MASLSQTSQRTRYRQEVRLFCDPPPQFAMQLGGVVRPHPESTLGYVARTKQIAHIDGPLLLWPTWPALAQVWPFRCSNEDKLTGVIENARPLSELRQRTDELGRSADGIVPTQ